MWYRNSTFISIFFVSIIPDSGHWLKFLVCLTNKILVRSSRQALAEPSLMTSMTQYLSQPKHPQLHIRRTLYPCYTQIPEASITASQTLVKPQCQLSLASLFKITSTWLPVPLRTRHWGERSRVSCWGKLASLKRTHIHHSPTCIAWTNLFTGTSCLIRKRNIYQVKFFGIYEFQI